VLPSVGDKNPQISLSRGVVLSQSTFHLVLECTGPILTKFIPKSYLFLRLWFWSSFISETAEATIFKFCAEIGLNHNRKPSCYADSLKLPPYNKSEAEKRHYVTLFCLIIFARYRLSIYADSNSLVSAGEAARRDWLTLGFVTQLVCK